MPLYGCQTPDGYKNTQDAWLNPGRDDDAAEFRHRARSAGICRSSARMFEFAADDDPDARRMQPVAMTPPTRLDRRHDGAAGCGATGDDPGQSVFVTHDARAIEDGADRACARR